MELVQDSIQLRDFVLRSLNQLIPLPEMSVNVPLTFILSSEFKPCGDGINGCVRNIFTLSRCNPILVTCPTGA
jgi:hypothetical protein